MTSAKSGGVERCKEEGEGKRVDRSTFSFTWHDAMLARAAFPSLSSLL